MRTYRVFTIMSFVVWLLALIGELVTARTFNVAVMFYLVMAAWAGFTIVEEENTHHASHRIASRKSQRNR